MTPLLRPVWWRASSGSFSSRRIARPGCRRPKIMAVARPTMPPPMMAQSKVSSLIGTSRERLALENHFATMETLGPTCGRVGFNPTQAEQTEKEVFGKPLFVSLGAEVFHKPLDFFPADGI